MMVGKGELVYESKKNKGYSVKHKCPLALHWNCVNTIPRLVQWSGGKISIFPSKEVQEMDQYTQEMCQETQEVLEVQEIYLGIQEMCAGKG